MTPQHSSFEFGIYTLADLGTDPLTGKQISSTQRVTEIIETAKIADELGLDIFGIGEHHRLDYAVSSTAVTLGAISQVTKNIKLTSATTVLSTVDPVRLFEDYATLDLLSNGRAEIIAGRGAFLESFPLFGYDTSDYDALFEENTALFLLLNKHDRLTWSGSHRASLFDAEIAPRPIQQEIPLWIGVGGSPTSAERAGRFGRGMAIAILGGDATRFQPLVEAYRKAALEAGHPQEQLKIAVTGHTFIAPSYEQAKSEFYPYYANYKNYVNKQRGLPNQLTREQFDEMASPDTALFVGSPDEIIEKIIKQHSLFGHTRFIAQLDIGALPFDKIVRSLELLATKVAPAVRKEIAAKTV